MIEITEVRIYTNNIANITINGCFVVHGIKIFNKKTGDGYIVSMPNRKTKNGERIDICHPIDKETRKMIDDAVIKAYEESLAESVNAVEV